MVVYLSDGERGGERHFVGKAETETGEGDAPFRRRQRRKISMKEENMKLLSSLLFC